MDYVVRSQAVSDVGRGVARRAAVRPAVYPGLLPPVAALGCTLLCIGLWSSGHHAWVLSAMHLLASNYFQFDQPFADTYGLLGVMECFRRGIDIYVSNPCDLYGRPHVYSSVWLLGARTGVTTGWTPVVGSVLALAFCSSLFLLPRARGRWSTVLITVATLSNAVIFACYQGNNDLCVFVMVALAGWCLLRRGGTRSAGYGLLLAAGSLKFYPVALMAMAGRERPRRLAVVTAWSCVALAAFLWLYGADAARVLHLIPSGKITQMSGAGVIGRGLAVFPFGVRQSVAAPPLPWYGLVVEAVLLLAAAYGAVAMVRNRRLNAAVSALGDPEKIFAALGCILVVACFVAGQSYRYRSIFLLFALPAATSLMSHAPARFVRVVFGMLAVSMVALLWAVLAGNALDHIMAVLNVPERLADLVYAAFWLSRECVWWAVVGGLAGLLACLAAEWPLPRRLLSGSWELTPIKERHLAQDPAHG